MKLWLNGVEPPEHFRRRVEHLAAEARALVPETLQRRSPEHSVRTQLPQAADESDFDRRWLDCLEHSIALSTADPPAAGRLGFGARIVTAVRRAAWALLGRPHERLALRQSRINRLLLDAIRQLRHDLPRGQS